MRFWLAGYSGEPKSVMSDIQKLNIHDLRRSIGLVSQDVFLFHGTVAENIADGSFDANNEQIIEVAKVAEADDFIMGLPQNYETIVGERGQKLSAGQRQRIARAIAQFSKIRRF